MDRDRDIVKANPRENDWFSTTNSTGLNFNLQVHSDDCAWPQFEAAVKKVETQKFVCEVRCANRFTANRSFEVFA